MSPHDLISLPFRAAIRAYQIVLSPILTLFFGPSCRFHPSCSAYGLECYRRHNVFRATRLTLWRILRCNPFFKGGNDPVPE